MSGPRVPGRPLRILLSREAGRRLAGEIDQALGGVAHELVAPDTPRLDADVAFVSRDVTGLSTKHEIQPATQAFYDALDAAPSLGWVHAHSAGADRPVYVRLRARGVQVTTSSGANAAVVAQTALAGLLALARHLPQLAAAQRESRWAPLIASGLPRDLEGEHAVLVGWGPIAQKLGLLLQALGLRVTVVRQRQQEAGAGFAVVTSERLQEVLPTADWLLLACPLTERTRDLIDATALARLPSHARLVNVSRGEVIVEPALIAALQQGRLGGAFLDVFAHEPLPSTSPLWAMPNVIVTPHSAGFSDGNAARVQRMFLDNLRRWCAGEPLHNLAAD